MNDIFTFSRGKILISTDDVYGRVFSEARSKTTEHNIYERVGKNLVSKNEKSQKSTETGKN